ncbi:MAG: hypothetical protein H0V87_03395 [Chloroflexi bacterium]|nr:hypothetical protein [Chloroflexota bacterium]
MTDDRLERSLRALLGERDPGPAPEGVRRLVAQVPNEPPAHAQRPRLGVLAQLAAAVVVIAVTGGFVLATMSGRSGESGESTGASGLPLRPGVGLASPAAPVIPIVVVLLAGAVAVALIVRVRPGPARVAIAGIAVALISAYVSMGDRVAFRVIAFGAQPADRLLASEATADRYLVRVGQNEPYRLFVTIFNDAAETVTVLGLDPGAAPPGPAPHFVGLGRTVDSLDMTFDAAGAFEPVGLASGDWLSLIVLGNAGPCAGSNDTGGLFVHDTLPLVTRIAGWERPIQVPLDVEVTIPVRGDCPEWSAGQSRIALSNPGK